MTTYTFDYPGLYLGGVIIVAAKSLDEAIEYASSILDIDESDLSLKNITHPKKAPIVIYEYNGDY